MRAVVDNADLAALTGAPPITDRPHQLDARLRARRRSPACSTRRRPGDLDAVTLTFFVLSAYGAAVFGRLRSLPLTFAGAIVLGPRAGLRARSASPTTLAVVATSRSASPGSSSSSPCSSSPRRSSPSAGSSAATPRRCRACPRASSARALFIPAVALAGRRGRRLPRRPHPGAGLRRRSCCRSCCSPATPARSRSPSTCSSASAPSPWARSPAATASLGMAAAAAIAVPLGIITALPGPAAAGPLPGARHLRPRAGVARRDLPGPAHLRRRARSRSAASRSSASSFDEQPGLRRPLRHRVRARRDRRARAATRRRSGGGSPPCATARRPAPPSASTCAARSSPCSPSPPPSPAWPARCTAGSGFSASQLQFEPLFNVLLFLFAFVGGITTITGALLGGLLFAALPARAVRGTRSSPGSCSPPSPSPPSPSASSPTAWPGCCSRRFRGAPAPAPPTPVDVPRSRAADAGGGSMRLPDRRRSLALLMGAAALLGLARRPRRATPRRPPPARPARSSSAPTPSRRAATAMRVRYEIEGLLPGGAPVLDLGMPEALARFTSGPDRLRRRLARLSGRRHREPALAGRAGRRRRATSRRTRSRRRPSSPPGPPRPAASSRAAPPRRSPPAPLGVDVLATYPGHRGPAGPRRRQRPHRRPLGHRGRQGGEPHPGRRQRHRRCSAGVITIDSVVTDLVAVHDGTAGIGVRAAPSPTACSSSVSTRRSPRTGWSLQEAPPVEGPGAPLGGVLSPVVPPAGEALSPIQDGAQRRARPGRARSSTSSSPWPAST